MHINHTKSFGSIIDGFISLILNAGNSENHISIAFDERNEN